MQIKELKLTNYRNYEKAAFCPEKGLNVVFGCNAQGKTNLIEAISLASVGRSPRTPRDRELIRWGQESAAVRVVIETRGGDESVELYISQKENKRLAINKLPVTRIGELMGVMPTVFFSPQEIKVVGSSPGERRSFMDIALSMMSKSYFYLLSRYNKTLSQRNKLLKSGRADDDSLYVWDRQLAGAASKIVKTRKGFIKNLLPLAQKNHAYLTDSAEELTLSYDGAAGQSENEIEQELLSELLRTRESDRRLGFTHIGPQKDDLIIKANDIDLRSYGSQGQLRTAALSLKLSELDLHYSEKGECPVLLLDDVLSELDIGRQRKLLERVRDYQTIITLTEPDPALFKIELSPSFFKVTNGSVEKILF